MAYVLDCTTDAESQLDQILADYLQLAPPARPGHDQLIAAHPEHAEALRQILQDLGWMQHLAGPPVDEAPPETERYCKSAPASTSPDDALSTIDAGRYVGLQPHARGGLGEVYTALDRELHRKVALKRIRDDHAQDPRSQRYFLVEAEVTARLDHPGVVPVHSLFRDDHDRPCYTMRFIEGDTLDDAIKHYHAGPPDPVAFRRLLQSFIQVCETVAYAHSRGVIHRDLKPQNIMIGKFGETIVVDWGLAKVVGRKDDRDPSTTSPVDTLRLVSESSLDRTAMGAAVGTPAYMSPEQAAGRWDIINPASDIYNLGAVLYALLTGKPPIEGTNWPDIQQKIQRGDFPRPRDVMGTVPRALEAICLKAMAMNPQERYHSARELANEVERWQANEPVAAYREPAHDRLVRWARKHKVLVTSATVAMLVLAISVAVVLRVKADAEASELIAKLKIEGMQHFQNGSRLGALLIRFSELEQSARSTLDNLANQVAHHPQLNDTSLRPLRENLMRETIEFWDRAIKLDATGPTSQGARTPFYRRQRALYLARLGEYEDAAAEAAALSKNDEETSGEVAYELARIYSLCTSAAGDNRRLVETYSEQALALLRKAAHSGYLKNSTGIESPDSDPDFAPLKSRTDFLELTRESEDKTL